VRSSFTEFFADDGLNFRPQPVNVKEDYRNRPAPPGPRSVAGVPNEIMGEGPIPASKAAIKKSGLRLDQMDVIESNEAFAAQAIAVNRQMGWDTKKVNVNGGAIALGHPIGASGCRILVTLLHEMQKRDAKRGLASLCIGGGMGVAMAVERA